MSACENVCDVTQGPIVDRLREPSHEHPPRAAMDFWERFGKTLDLCVHGLDLLEELRSEADGLLLIPCVRVRQVRRRQRPDVDPSHLLPPLLQAVDDFLPDFRPRAASLWMGLEIGEALIQKGLFFFGQQQRLHRRILSDTIPDVLHELEALWDR